MDTANLDRARAVYSAIRNCWVADGSANEAHERLSVITVAAGIRDFAFRGTIESRSQSTVAHGQNQEGME